MNTDRRAMGALITLLILAGGAGTTASAKAVPKTIKKAPAATSVPPPRRYSGSGDMVLAIAKPSAGRAIGTFTHNGTSNFAVWAEDKNLRQTDLLVNTIGSYTGTVAIDFGGGSTAYLEISADGPWTVAIRSPLEARRFTGSVSGRGADVVYFNRTAAIAAITHSGASNFAVWHYPSSGYPDLLVNAIGAYRGSRPLRGSGYLVIQADGPWAVNAA